MFTSTISETKNRLSELLHRVQAGEALVILDRDCPIAKVVSITVDLSNMHLVPPKDPTALACVLELPIGGSRGVPTGVLAALLEERETGR